jgi:uncharacterized repeat protein (TIGR01451 family)
LPIDGAVDGTPYVRDWDCDWAGSGYFSGSSMHGIVVYSGAKTFQLPSGVIVSGSISGHKYDDVDGSGNLTAGDVGIENWPITLTGFVEGFPVGPVITMTDSTGYYEYPDMPEGSGPYCITEAPDNGFAVPSGYEGYAHTSPPVICDINASRTDVDFFNVGCGEVSITKEDFPDPVICPGDPITYNLTVANAGPGTATGIYVEDTLPNITLTDVKLDGSSTGNYTVSSGVLRYPATGGVSLDSGQFFMLTIEGTANDCDPLVNSVTVFADNDCSEEGNTATTTTARDIPAVVPNLITDSGIGSCQSQATVNSSYAAWAAGLSFSGGCNRFDDIVIPDAPDHCGGVATVTWNVTSDCEDPITGSATYTVADAPALVVVCPDDYSGAYGLSCSLNASITGSPMVSGGCDPQVSYSDDITPGDTCGWTVNRTWTITDLCESYTCNQYISCVCPTCDTAVAAQGPGYGSYLFLEASSWFTYIQYDGSGNSTSPVAYPIYTDQTYRIGTLYVYDEGDHVFVRYTADVDPGDCTWIGFTDYHIEVVDEPNGFGDILNKSGNPIPGQCEYKGLWDPPELDTDYIELSEDIGGYGDTIYIFAHSIFCYYCP